MPKTLPSPSVPMRLLLLVTLASSVGGMPYQIVNSGRPKCVTAELPAHTVVRIHYDAPDLNVAAPDVDQHTKDHLGPTYITVMERPIVRVADLLDDDDDDDDDDYEGRPKKKRATNAQELKKNPPKSTELKETIGTITHKVLQDSEVNICIRASLAGSKNPMRFGLRVEELSEEEVEEEEEEKAQPTANVDKHLTNMEHQLGHIEHMMRNMIRNADMAKEVDAVHHRHTDALHKATTFWPFVHCGILLVTGFTQVNHIVRFFKSRRII